MDLVVWNLAERALVVVECISVIPRDDVVCDECVFLWAEKSVEHCDMYLG